MFRLRQKSANGKFQKPFQYRNAPEIFSESPDEKNQRPAQKDLRPLFESAQ
jgi:hypothetical protein